MATVIDRLASKFVARENGCWEWTAYRTTLGYGRISHEGRVRPAHVVAYEQFVGPVPEGLELDHLCRVRHCINPDHLEPVTHAENMRRSTVFDKRRGQTHCKRGHELSGSNLLLITRVKRGNTLHERHCRACKNAAKREARRRAKED